MFIHLGGDTAIPLSEVIGIFDIEGTTIFQTTRDFLKVQEEEGFIVNISEDIPKTFIVTDKKVYLSPISSTTLKKRSMLIGNTTTNKNLNNSGGRKNNDGKHN